MTRRGMRDGTYFVVNSGVANMYIQEKQDKKKSKKHMMQEGPAFF